MNHAKRKADLSGSETSAGDNDLCRNARYHLRCRGLDLPSTYNHFVMARDGDWDGAGRHN